MGKKNNRAMRKDAAQAHIAQMGAEHQKENMDAIATAKRYKGSKVESTMYFEPRFTSTETAVVATDSVSALFEDSSPHQCLLDFASYHNPGGGYENGAWAQEEALCSESNLWNVLDAFYESYYKPHKATHNGGLYTTDALYLHDILFTRGDDTIASDVIVIAAPNAKSAKESSISDEEIEEALACRVRATMNIAAENEADELVLGAFGCGVFANDPRAVAGMFKEWLDANDGVFKRVVFAILPGGENLGAFQEVFDK